MNTTKLKPIRIGMAIGGTIQALITLVLPPAESRRGPAMGAVSSMVSSDQNL